MGDNVTAPFDLILVDPKPELCAAWCTAFGEWVGHGVQIVNGRFENLPNFDLLVSAANSFGLMDGGVDAAIVNYFGEQVAVRVQAKIREEYLGEQPVGTCLIVPTGDPKHPFLAHTPTMRVPEVIAGTDNVYNAMRAMLLAVRKHNAEETQQIRTVVCPGLGSGVGMMTPQDAARQMATAYAHFVDPPTKADWRDAIDRHLRITMPIRRQRDAASGYVSW
jgi:O-acetyl-ADP-ribose deacetylase (regulator of RNase III)